MTSLKPQQKLGLVGLLAENFPKPSCVQEGPCCLHCQLLCPYLLSAISSAVAGEAWACVRQIEYQPSTQSVVVYIAMGGFLEQRIRVS